MRRIEGLSVTGEVVVGAEPGVVWRLVTDIAVLAEVSPELQRAEWLDATAGPAPGAAFVGYNRHPALGDWRTVSHVVGFEPHHVFEWAVVDPDDRFGGQDADPAFPVATWRFELAPEGVNTRLRQSVRLGPARSGLTLTIERSPERADELVEIRLRQLRAGIEATLDGIKRRAERD